MQKEAIIQFVSFETNVNSSEFISQWEGFTREMNKAGDVKLFQEAGNLKRSKYISQHTCFDSEFNFLFKKERRSAHNPEIEMKVRQLGGYSAVQLQYDGDMETEDCKVFLFSNINEAGLNEIRLLTGYRSLNIYKAYFESCTHEYVLSFLTGAAQAGELLQQLKLQNRHCEAGAYKECLVMAE
jgi:hypothetical protein